VLVPVFATDTIFRVVKEGSGTSLWLTFGTVVVGALLAGLLNFLLQRSAWKREAEVRAEASLGEVERQRDAWLREARAAIFRGPLPPVHNMVNSMVQEMKKPGATPLPTFDDWARRTRGSNVTPPLRAPTTPNVSGGSIRSGLRSETCTPSGRRSGTRRLATPSARS
jgi:hypothetical protein